MLPRMLYLEHLTRGVSSKRQPSSSPLPRTDRRYTQSTVVSYTHTFMTSAAGPARITCSHAASAICSSRATSARYLQLAYNFYQVSAAATDCSSLNTHHVFAPLHATHATDHSRRLERCKDAIMQGTVAG